MITVDDFYGSINNANNVNFMFNTTSSHYTAETTIPKILSTWTIIYLQYYCELTTR